MRWLGALVLLAACKSPHPAAAPGSLSLVLDIPNGALDPVGYSSVEIVLHEPTRDVVRSATVSGGTFDLGSIDPSAAVSVEATLRNDSGAAVGYGRTSAAAAFAGGAEIVVPVRRPIAYIAGTVSTFNIATQTLTWSEAPATFSDLSVDSPPDGKAQLGGQVVNMVAAGPSLYLITQGVDTATGTLTGAARVAPVAMTDHTIGAALTGTMSGSVLDSAGSDDGTIVVVGTSTQLYALDTRTGVVTTLANGAFARVVIAMGDSGELTAIAIKNRGATTGPCATTAELWWIPVATPSAAHAVATGGYSDVAADRGHAYYLEACKGELGEVTSAATTAARTVTDASLGRPTALAVSNGQAFVGFENPPATTSLIGVALVGTVAPRKLWTETAQLIMDSLDLTEVQRRLAATSITFGDLQVGAGGDYVALTTRATFHGAESNTVPFPDTTIDVDELRVFDAATGAAAQRYRSWCRGIIFPMNANDLTNWSCAAAPGQSIPASQPLTHRIRSMTFLYGKK
jgi:hypothetical protein